MKNRAKQAVAFVRKDYEVLEEQLLEAFPDVRFIDADRSFDWLDYDAMRRHPDDRKRELERIFLPKSEWRLRYLDHLFSDDRTTVKVWREPPDWRMEYMGPDREGNFSFANLPEMSLRIPMCRFEDDSRRDLGTSPPVRANNDRSIILIPVTIQTNHDENDNQQSEDVQKIWSILNKMMTNSLMIFSADGSRSIEPAEKGGMLWAGTHALEWTLEHPKNFINWGWNLYRSR